jgi:hypothetical protein
MLRFTRHRTFRQGSFIVKLETTELHRVAQCFALPGVRWSAVMAGMSVGIGAYVLLMLLGACAGLAVLSTERGAQMDAQGAALLWNLLAALAASLAGGAVAARAADLRRHVDGMMHGLVVWGVSVLVAVLLAITAMHAVADGVGALIAHNADGQSAYEGMMNRDMPYPRGSRISRAAHEPVLLDGAADSSGQGYRYGREQAAAPADQGRAMYASMYLALMLCAAVVMALCGGIAGGVLGTRAPRRPDPLDHANWREVIDILDH